MLLRYKSSRAGCGIKAASTSVLCGGRPAPRALPAQMAHQRLQDYLCKKGPSPSEALLGAVPPQNAGNGRLHCICGVARKRGGYSTSSHAARNQSARRIITLKAVARSQQVADTCEVFQAACGMGH